MNWGAAAGWGHGDAGECEMGGWRWLIDVNSTYCNVDKQRFKMVRGHGLSVQAVFSDVADQIVG